MIASSDRIKLPLVTALTISHFSLYRHRSENRILFDRDVFCLAGANGLGKSTFLAILNYAYTGAVAPAEPKVLSLAEYYKSAKSWAREYFEGRVHEDDRDLAEVAIEFKVGSYSYGLRRGMFNPAELRGLRIEGPGINISREADPDDSDSGSLIHDEFVENLLRHSGLAKFEQLVYLQHFLLTFDERRHLLFWDPEVARAALFLVFGVDTDEANKMGEWQRAADRQESQARNAQYQSTTARTQIRELKSRAGLSIPGEAELEEKLDSLNKVRDEAAADAERSAAHEKDVRLKLAVRTADQQALMSQYDRIFSERLHTGSAVERHPLILSLLNEHSCGLCGASELVATEHITEDIAAGRCPLCHTVTTSGPETKDDFAKLRELDDALRTVKAELDTLRRALERVVKTRDDAETALASVTKQLKDFEDQNSEWLIHATANRGVSEVIRQLEAESRAALERRANFRRKRDEYQSKIKPLRQEFARKYSEAELNFVPQFQSLARAFLGIDLHIDMEQRARGPELLVSMNGERRRDQSQLSESQKYFIDIALRMALVQHLTHEQEPACLLIDTPEGSLDIAYERRAGEMFGMFVKQHNRLIMTANLNSNRLVLELARVCKADLMHVERMTNWSVLSEVQAEAEDLFDASFATIGEYLNGSEPS